MIFQQGYADLNQRMKIFKNQTIFMDLLVLYCHVGFYVFASIVWHMLAFSLSKLSTILVS